MQKPLSKGSNQATYFQPICRNGKAKDAALIKALGQCVQNVSVESVPVESVSMDS